jgi:hypothetical protein
MNQTKLLAIVGIALGALVACGRAPNGDSLFTKENVWKEPSAPGDTEVSPDEFRKGVASGDLVLTSTASLEAAKRARQDQYEKDKALLQGLADKSPSLQRLLDEAASQADYEADRRVTGADGETVVLFGRGTQLRNAVEIQRRAQSLENALADYAQTYSLLPADIKANAAAPDSLAGKPLTDVRAALSALNKMLAGSPRLKGAVRLERDPQGALPARQIVPGGKQGRSSALEIGPGNGTDNNGVCAQRNLFNLYWFPLKSFISPIKDQARRGACWAFTAVGALESRERVQNDNPADLSEQFLMNKVKQDWDANDFVDGYWPEKALETAVDRGQSLPSESAWTYNPARGRAATGDGESAYGGTCNNYTGTCSDTAHESRRVCTTFIVRFCSYARVNYSGPGVASGRTTQVWSNGQDFDLNRYRLLLAEGHVLMAEFPVYTGFMDNENIKDGVVSVYRTTKKDDKGKEVDGSYGLHAVQIVGFLDNGDLSAFGNVSKVGGGGYFIVKNSWGCGGGDGGYYYVPADYVSSLFNALSVLDFDGRRSDAWNREQAAPGGSVPPKIDIRTAQARVDLRVQSDLASFFKVSHPVAASVNLTVVSDRDGALYNGPWITDSKALFGSSLKLAFATEGLRSLSLVAQYGSSVVRATLVVNAVNTPPVLTLDYSGSPNQGEDYPIAALIKDINEPDISKLCTFTTWSVDAPDRVAVATGCLQKVNFGTTGARQVRVTTHDSEGATASQTLLLDVLPPPVNPYPRIRSAGLVSSELVPFLRRFICGEAAVGGGSTIDLRDTGCVLAMHRYWTKVDVENPAGEALTYDWKLYVSNAAGESVLYGVTASSSPSFALQNWGNAIPVTNDCRVTLTVNAPDPSRSKSLSVWSGKCSYDAYQLR